MRADTIRLLGAVKAMLEYDDLQGYGATDKGYNLLSKVRDAYYEVQNRKDKEWSQV